MSEDNHVLNGTIDDAEKAINNLATVEEVSSYRAYEKENKDRDGIYDLLNAREVELVEAQGTASEERKTTVEKPTEPQTKKAVKKENLEEKEEKEEEVTIEATTSDYDSMREKLFNLNVEQLSRLNPDILKKYDIKIVDIKK